MEKIVEINTDITPVSFKALNLGETSQRLLKSADMKLKSPQARFINGIVAISTQPFIDYFNKRVDKETRVVSAARTSAKIIAGTTVGVIVRQLCLNLGEKLIKNGGICALPYKTLNATLTQIAQYRNIIGSIASLGVMLFTNFLLDAPLTVFLTNKFVPFMKKHCLKESEVKNG